MAGVRPVRYGTEQTVLSSYPWTLTRRALRTDGDEASVEFDGTVDPAALRCGLADTHAAAALGTESPTLVIDGELKRTANLYCFADDEKLNYRAVFAPFAPVVEVRLRWHHRPSGIDINEVLPRER